MMLPTPWAPSLLSTTSGAPQFVKLPALDRPVETSCIPFCSGRSNFRYTLCDPKLVQLHMVLVRFHSSGSADVNKIGTSKLSGCVQLRYIASGLASDTLLQYHQA